VEASLLVSETGNLVLSHLSNEKSPLIISCELVKSCVIVDVPCGYILHVIVYWFPFFSKLWGISFV